MRILIGLCRRNTIVVTAILLICQIGQGQDTVLSVFDFRMTSDSAEWRWLEKGLADLITTDVVQLRSFTVIERDRMQRLAQQMRWAPELATKSEKAANRLSEELKVELLVSGVYEISDDKITITSQIVQVESREEVFRHSVSGPTAELVQLQKELSSQLLGWLTHQKPSAIKHQLPVWTKSVPAMRSFYEGMDLYDQGRYADAWQRFRTASAADPEYAEASYFVGKMYYLMHHYQHARMAIEHFVQQNNYHPRVTDAIAEYVHILLENGLTWDEIGPEADRLAEQFGHSRLRTWVRHERVAHAFAEGRYDQAHAIAVTSPDYLLTDMPLWMTATAMYATTGQTVPIDQLIVGYRKEAIECRLPVAGNSIFEINLPPRSDEQHIGGGIYIKSFGEPDRGPGEAVLTSDKSWSQTDQTGPNPVVYGREWLVAPSGYCFERLSFMPRGDGADALVDIQLADPTVVPLSEKDPWFTVPGAKLYQPRKTASLDQAGAKGIVFSKLPPLGYIRCDWRCRLKDPTTSNTARFQGFKVAATLSRMEQVGAFRLDCPQTARIRVLVDGRTMRWGPGIVGPLRPGRHVVRVEPHSEQLPYQPWEGQIIVEADKVRPIRCNLQWKAPHWLDWHSVDLGLSTAARLQLKDPPPSRNCDNGSLYVDDNMIAAVWSDEDLWICTSSDGKTFSSPRRLATPVSTTYFEGSPRLIRQDNGRYVLFFTSNRQDDSNKTQPYMTWSRDLGHWADPMLMEGLAPESRIIRAMEHKGRFIGIQRRWNSSTIVTSSDLVHWKRIKRFRSEAEPAFTLSTEGLFRLVTSRVVRPERARYKQMLDEQPGDNPALLVVEQFVSRDLQRWQKRVAIVPRSHRRSGDLRLHGLTDAQARVIISEHTVWPRTILLEERGRRRVSVTAGSGSLLQVLKDAAYHSRWGYLFLIQPKARVPGGTKVLAMPDRPEPLMFMAAKTLDNLSTNQESVALLDAEDAEVVVEQFAGNKHKLLALDQPTGQLVPFAGTPTGGYGLLLTEQSHFHRPRAGDGTTSRNAVVVKMNQKRPLYMALDSENPEAVQPTLGRLNLSGNRTFHEALLMPYRRNQVWGTLEATFVHPHDKLLIPMVASAEYVPQQRLSPERRRPRDGDMAFIFRLNFGAQAVCRIAGRPKNIVLINADHNLRLDDKLEFSRTRGGVRLLHGDIYYVGNRSDRIRDVRDLACDYLFSNLFDEQELFGFYGQPVVVNGKSYMLEISEDSTHASVQQFDKPTGEVQVDWPRWEAWFVGRQYILRVRGGTEPVHIPADQYDICRYQVWTSKGRNYDRSANNAPCFGTWVNTPEPALIDDGEIVTSVDVKPGSRVKLPLGAPVQLQVIPKVLDGGKLLNVSVGAIDRHGHRIDVFGLDFKCAIESDTGKELLTWPSNVPLTIPKQLSGEYIVTLKDVPVEATIESATVNLQN